MHATSVGKAGLPTNLSAKQKIAEKVESLSKGSKYWQKNQEKLAKQTLENQKIKEKLKSQMSYQNLEKSKQKSTSLKQNALELLNIQVHCSRYIVHIDMDSFFASVEMKNLRWDKNRPLAVGGESMLSTANYAARKFGVRSAMPGFIARKLCPELVIVGSNYDSYKESSGLAQEIFREYSEIVVMGSLDEAYLDLTEHMISRELTDHRKICKKCFEVTAHLDDMRVKHENKENENKELGATNSETNTLLLPWNSIFLMDYEKNNVCKKCNGTEFHEAIYDNTLKSAIEEIRFRVELITGGLTCSAGVSINTFLAKCLSDKAKPDGSKILIAQNGILKFIKDLPVGRAPGIGPVTEKLLKDVYGIENFADIRDKIKKNAHLKDEHLKGTAGLSGQFCGAQLLCLMEDEGSAKYYIELAYGVGGTLEIENLDGGERKGLGQETTFSENIELKEIAKLEEVLQGLCEGVSETMLRENLFSKTVCIKFTTDSFDKFTRQKKVEIQFVQKHQKDSVFKKIDMKKSRNRLKTSQQFVSLIAKKTILSETFLNLYLFFQILFEMPEQKITSTKTTPYKSKYV